MVNDEPSRPCKECSGGQMRLRKVTYYTWLVNELITIPDFPAWVCDVCGRREYDQHALSQLNLILSPNAGKPPITRKRMANKRPTPKLKTRRP